MHNFADPAPVPAARALAQLADQRAPAHDVAGSFPAQDVVELGRLGLLHAPLPVAHGGAALGSNAATAPALRDVLRVIGGASLPLGRLYEGHVNAIRLVTRFGTDSQLGLLRDEADAGRLSAVWNAEVPPGLSLDDGTLKGAKRYTSGTGHVRRPLLTARQGDDVYMVIPDISGSSEDLTAWTPMGMAASATGHVDFTGLHVSSSEIVGAPGDYYRSPYFAGGAWRVLAVQLGGLERLVAEFRNAVKNSGKAGDPVQRARFGETVARLETARLWSARAALMAEDESHDPATIDAFVNLARHSFERAALDLIERVQRGIGLSAMLRPARVELVMRDLLTYLRQPFPDGALDAAARWALDTDADMHSDIGEP